MRRTKTIIKISFAISGLIVLCILFFDRPASVFISKYLTTLKPFFYKFTLLLDELSNKILWLLVVDFILGVALTFKKRAKKVAYVMLAMVFVHISSSILINAMKQTFERARPEVYLRYGDQTEDFHNQQTKDFSFPSSHTAFYLSLFLPAALMFRKYAAPLLIIPGIVAVGRVVQNEHYLSDIVCSILIVFDLCAIVFGLFYWLDKRFISKEHLKLQENIAADNSGLASVGLNE